MTVLREGGLTFTFPPGSAASKYDDWSFYRNQVKRAFGGAKAVDFVYEDGEQAWLIEVKDYRAHPRTKLIDLGEEVAFKVRDTLAGLVAAKCSANDQVEKRAAKALVGKRRIRVVLHIEQPANPSRLFPQVANPANLKLKLKQLLKCVDAHPAVVNQHNLSADMNWTVAG